MHTKSAINYSLGLEKFMMYFTPIQVCIHFFFNETSTLVLDLCMLWICCSLACCLPSFHSTLPKALMWVPTYLNVLVNSCLFHKLSKVALFPEVMALTSKYLILKITWNSFQKLECQSYVPTLSPGSFSFSSLCSVFMACKGVFI